MPGWWRLLGFGGSVLLAASAFAPFAVSIPLWCAGLAALGFAWWKGALSTVLTGALVAVPLLLAPPLGSSDVYSYACQGWLWINGSDPYTTGVLDGGCPWAAEVPEIWWHTPAPYGPLAIAISGAAAATGNLTAALAILRLAALAGAAILIWHLPTLTRFTRLTRPGLDPHPSRRDQQPSGSRPKGSGSPEVELGRSSGLGWVLALGVISPLVLVHGLSGAHNDLLMAGLMVAALAVATGRRSNPDMPDIRQSTRWAKAALAGVLIAGAIAIKVTAIVALPFVLILLTSHHDPRRYSAAGAGLVGAVVTFMGLTAVTGLGFGWVTALGGTGGVTQWSSPPTAVGMTVSYVLRLFGVDSGVPVTVARALALVALAVAGLILVKQAWQGKRDVIVACGLALAATTLLGPVFYPWYAIAPIAVLATTELTASREGRPGPPRASDLKILILICTALALPSGDGTPALTKLPGALIVTGILAWLGFRKLSPGRAV